MIFHVSASFEGGGTISGVRYTEENALKLALEFREQGYFIIQVATDDATYSLDVFRSLVE